MEQTVNFMYEAFLTVIVEVILWIKTMEQTVNFMYEAFLTVIVKVFSG